MNNNKIRIIELIERAVATNVLGDKAYVSRFKGFIGELEFPCFAEKVWGNIDLFPGCYLVPTRPESRSMVNPVLFSAGTRDYQGLSEVYKKLSLIGCEKLFYFQFSGERQVEKWERNGFSSGFSSPPYEVYLYDEQKEKFEISSTIVFTSLFADKRSPTKFKEVPTEIKEHYRGKLLNFSEDSLTDLYLQRLVFDTLIGCKKDDGLPSDIDFIGYSPKLDSFVVLEVKEKDLSKARPRGFGMDIDRINDLTTLQDKTGMQVFYLVREVADQVNRQFLRWRSIRLDTFRQNLGEQIQGGHGMGFAEAKYPTRVCPEQYFAIISADVSSRCKS